MTFIRRAKDGGEAARTRDVVNSEGPPSVPSAINIFAEPTLISLVCGTALGPAKHQADELEVAFEQLVNEIDHNCEYCQSTQEPYDSPEENNDYDC